MHVQNKLLAFFGMGSNSSLAQGKVGRSPLTRRASRRFMSPLLQKLQQVIPVNETLTDRWDREWLAYFLTEDPRPFLLSYQELKIIDEVKGKKPVDVYHTRLVATEEVGAFPPLCIWIDGDHIVGKHILELGCGPGLLGKQVGQVAASYMGIDYSRLAIHLARLTSSPQCTYYHLAELDQIITHTGTIDAMVGRFFFIHQNYQNLFWILVLASILLKPGGVISADFYLRNPAVPQGIIYPAHHDLDERYPSCAFEYTELDILQVARETDFRIANIIDNIDLQRRFTLFVKPL
jgi:2-polyprenyl-3-methyl-5-hydroxy-6-metoxy-1,4-benzoquinol methylase